MPLLNQFDTNLHYEIEGQGPPVLFIQGVGVTAEGWRPQVDGLAGRFQTLIFDNRGLARSTPCSGPVTIEAMAGDARALMDAAGWESAHVVGHSMGGVIAQQLALHCPDRVRSLSLLCTFARGVDAARPTPWAVWMGLRTHCGTRRMRREAFLEMLYPADHLRAADLEWLAARTEKIVGRDLAVAPPVLMPQLRALGRHNVFGSLGALAGIPTLVLSARHDRIARPAYGLALAKAIPGAIFEEIPDASHGVIIQQADRINRRLQQFLESAETAGNHRRPPPEQGEELMA